MCRAPTGPLKSWPTVASASKVDAGVWHDICQSLGKAFVEEMYQQGLETALQQMTAVLISHIPRGEGQADRPSQQ
jgi:uncharacterized membrane protein